MTAAERKLPAPPPNAENKPYFDAAAEGQAADQALRRLRRAALLSRAICPFCFSDRTEWRPAAGRGTIYTYSVMRRGVAGPYAIAYVTLDEGVTMLTNIVDCDFDSIRIGQPVRVVFKPTDGGPPVPMFTPN